MVLSRIAGFVCCWIFMASVATSGQQSQEPSSDTSQPVATTPTQLDSTENGVMPWRRVETRTEAGGNDIAIETIDVPGIEGQWQTVQNAVTETTRPSPNVTHVKRDVFVFDLQHKPMLLETTESDHVRVAANGTRTDTRTWSADLNGRLGLTSRVTQEDKSANGISQTTTGVFQPDINAGLAEVIRTGHTQRQITATDVHRESSVMYRDINGQWRPVETRATNIRGAGSAEQVEEETISRRDMNDTLGIAEKTVTRRSGTNGREDVVVERYVPRDPDAVHRSENRFDLSERSRISTRSAADGSRETIEEIESRSVVATGEPLRVRRRIVTTVRPIGRDRSEIVRQTFDLDPNGRLLLSATERREE